jgi:hypothetical protein
MRELTSFETLSVVGGFEGWGEPDLPRLTDNRDVRPNSFSVDDLGSMSGFCNDRPPPKKCVKETVCTGTGANRVCKTTEACWY